MIETPRGGFKRASLEALGVSWPPKGGWRHRLIGALVSEEQLAFAIHASETGKLTKALRKEESQQAIELQTKTSALASQGQLLA